MKIKMLKLEYGVCYNIGNNRNMEQHEAESLVTIMQSHEPRRPVLVMLGSLKSVFTLKYLNRVWPFSANYSSIMNCSDTNVLNPTSGA